MCKLLVVCLCLVHASAHAFLRFYLAYGDQHLVDIARDPISKDGPRDPSAAIGREISSDRPLLLPEIGESFSLEIHLVVSSTTSGNPLNFNSGAIFLGFDRDTVGATNYTSLEDFYAKADLGKLGIGGTTIANSIFDPIQGIPGITGGVAGLVNLQFQGSPALAGAFGSGATLRPIGIWTPYIFGAGNSALLPVSTDVRLATVQLSNRSLEPGEIMTDPNLTLHAATNATSRSNFVVTSPKADGYPITSAKYPVEGFDRGASLDQPPTIDSISDQVADEETPFMVQFVALDDDFPIHQLTFSLPGTPPTGASITPDGLLTYTPTEADGGNQRTIRVRVSDYYNKFAETDLKVTVREVKKSIQGSVLLQDFVGNPATEHLEVDFIREDGSVASHRTGIILKSNGGFSFGWASNEVSAGTYTVRAKASHWLSQAVGAVKVTSTGVDGLSFVLINGDVDGDNLVSIFDYAILSDAFDTREGDANFVLSADLDGDGWVTVWDYSILSQNFDKGGN